MVLWRNEDRCWGKLGTLGAYMGPLNFRPHIIQYNPRVQQKNLSVVRTSWKNGQTGKGKRVGAGVEQKDVIRSGSESLIHSSMVISAHGKFPHEQPCATISTHDLSLSTLETTPRSFDVKKCTTSCGIAASNGPQHHVNASAQRKWQRNEGHQKNGEHGNSSEYSAVPPS